MSGKLTYKQSGVDTKEAAAFVSDISSHVKRTQKQRSLHQAFGLFAAAYDLSSYKEPVIVTGCDGVGTKTEILFELDMVETAGKDLVAMNVNDILTTGGDPLLSWTTWASPIWNRNVPASPAWWPACATIWNPATASWPAEKRRKCPAWFRNPSWNSPASASDAVKKQADRPQDRSPRRRIHRLQIRQLPCQRLEPYPPHSGGKPGRG